MAQQIINIRKVFQASLVFDDLKSFFIVLSLFFFPGICASNLEGSESPIGVALKETGRERLERSAGRHLKGTAARAHKKSGNFF